MLPPTCTRQHANAEIALVVLVWLRLLVHCELQAGDTVCHSTSHSASPHISQCEMYLGLARYGPHRRHHHHFYDYTADYI